MFIELLYARLGSTGDSVQAKQEEIPALWGQMLETTMSLLCSEHGSISLGTNARSPQHEPRGTTGSSQSQLSLHSHSTLAALVSSLFLKWSYPRAFALAVAAAWLAIPTDFWSGLFLHFPEMYAQLSFTQGASVLEHCLACSGCSISS